ncbi:hypothetical protein CEXT_485681 [Caerostris extrusa]|uniref:Uncharacterized protein n=1 Tax=Caerostris extrusa TaxID=172846 RepID=A0AAV4VXW2_CAEEX|nr:hypothetical protein CEXT_485681 [Caerostris extrusa]
MTHVYIENPIFRQSKCDPIHRLKNMSHVKLLYWRCRTESDCQISLHTSSRRCLYRGTCNFCSDTITSRQTPDPEFKSFALQSR